MQDSNENSFESFIQPTETGHQYYMHHRTTMQGAISDGLDSAIFFKSMEDTEEVIQWLRAIGMHAYISTFRSHAVTAEILLSLTSKELRKSLDITRLKDRRTILEAIICLKQTVSPEATLSIPEDGRILTHLNNERMFLVWPRLSLLLNIVAIATIRLQNHDNHRNVKYIIAVSTLLSSLAMLVIVFGTCRYFWMHRLIETPGQRYQPQHLTFATSIFILAISVTITLYALMAQSTEQAALLVLLAV